MEDCLIRGTAKDGQIRFFAAITTNTVERARRIHDCTPVASAALGRMLTAASMMGTMLKNNNETITLQIKGGGEAGSIVAIGNSKSHVKGYISNAEIYRPLNSVGKLDVGGAVGREGNLTVIKDMGLKEPYIGQVPIVSGEIAEDLTYYFALSEQVPSAVSLGVLVGKDGSILSAGGFIVQMMPEAEDMVRDIIEYRLDEIAPVTKTIKDTEMVEEIISELLDGMEPKVLERYEPDFICDCTRERVERALISLGKDELISLINEDKETETVCHFCNEKYVFSKEQLKDLFEKAIK